LWGIRRARALDLAGLTLITTEVIAFLMLPNRERNTTRPAAAQKLITNQPKGMG